MTIPKTDYLCLSDIVGSEKRGVSPLVPISTRAWWYMVSRGDAPEGTKIGKKTYWHKSEIDAFVHGSRYLRLHDIIGCPKRGIQPRIPISKRLWLSMVSKGTAPKPYKFGRASLWLESELIAYILSLKGTRANSI